MLESKEASGRGRRRVADDAVGAAGGARASARRLDES
jgi:hypothetical protein